MLLGDIVKRYRKLHKLSTRSFGAMCDLSNGYISMIENNRNPNTGKPLAPNLETLSKLANGMGLSLDELIRQLDDEQLVLLTSQNRTRDSAPPLTPHENTVITAYRKQPAMQPAVDRLLGIIPLSEDTVIIRNAALTGGVEEGVAADVDIESAEDIDNFRADGY